VTSLDGRAFFYLQVPSTYFLQTDGFYRSSKITYNSLGTVW